MTPRLFDQLLSAVMIIGAAAAVVASAVTR
jgi:hypothetical protein